MTYAAVHSELQKPSPSSIIDLYELELFQPIHGVSEVWRFHPGTAAFGSGSNIVWNGNTYIRYPVEASGFEYSGNGQLPRPTLRVSNVLSSITAIMASLPNGIEGAKVTRIRTLARYLDAANFPARRNLFSYTEDFTNALWTKIGLQPFGSGSVANAIYAPDGTLSADLLVENTDVSAHGPSYNVINALTDSVFSVYAKAGPSADRYLKLVVFAAPSLSEVVTFDLVNGTYIGGTTTVVIKALGMEKSTDGWWRCWVHCVPSEFTAVRYRLGVAFTNTIVSYAGNGTSGIYLWGAQFELGTQLSAYQPVGATWTGNPYGTPNPTAEFPREVYYIDRKANENNEFVEFELATPFDLAGVRIPRRQALADLCAWEYKSAECSYAGALPTCSKTLDACREHFGASAWLPFGGFPGIGTYFT